LPAGGRVGGRPPPVLSSLFFLVFPGVPGLCASFFIGSALPDLPRTFPQAVLSFPRRFASKYADIRQEKRRRLFLCRNNKKARKGPFSRSPAVLCVCILPVKRKLPCLCQALRATPCGCDCLPLISSYRCRIGSKRPRAGSSGAVSLAFGTTKGRPTVYGLFVGKMNMYGGRRRQDLQGGACCGAFSDCRAWYSAPVVLSFDCSACNSRNLGEKVRRCPLQGVR